MTYINSSKTNFNDFVDEVKGKLEETKGAKVTEKEAKLAVSAVITSMAETVLASENGRLGLEGFGSFKLTKHKSRVGHNPQTGEEIMIDEHYRIGFKPATRLKDFINGRNDEYNFHLGLTLDDRTGKPVGTPVAGDDFTEDLQPEPAEVQKARGEIKRRQVVRRPLTRK